MGREPGLRLDAVGRVLPGDHAGVGIVRALVALPRERASIDRPRSEAIVLRRPQDKQETSMSEFFASRPGMTAERALGRAGYRRAVVRVSLVSRGVMLSLVIILGLLLTQTSEPYRAASPADPHVCLTHDAPIDCLVYSPDGRWLAWSAWDKTLGFLSTRHEDRGEPIHFHDLKRIARCLAVSPDSTLLAIGYFDGQAELWTVDPSQQRVALIWTVDPGRQSIDPDDAGRFVRSVSFAPDGKILATVSEDTAIRLWEVPAGKLRSTLAIPGVRFSRVLFSPDGRTLASARAGGEVILWDWPGERKLAALSPGNPPHYPEIPLAFSADGKMLAVGNVDRLIKLRDVATGRYFRTIGNRDYLITSVAFSPDGRMLVTAGGFGRIECWDVATGQRLALLRGHQGMVTAAAFSPVGLKMATVGVDRTLRLWAQGSDFPSAP
jgi:WD40 repeat protein